MGTHVTLYCHPNCSKSREARALAEARTSDLEIIDYLRTPLSHDALVALLAKLDTKPITLVRMKEPEAVDVALSESSTVDDVARALVARPSLMERPVLVVGDRAIIARPPSRVTELLGDTE